MAIIPCNDQTSSVKQRGQWVTQGRLLSIYDVTELSQSQETEVLTLDISHSYWAAPIVQIHHCFMLSSGHSRGPEKGFALWLHFHEPLL